MPRASVELREEYGDRVTFVARYFPMPGHRNGELAARTTEAAARQGEFKAMGSKLFLLRLAPLLLRGEVAGRVRQDQRDGLGLGVQGTPTFFFDGARIQNPGSYQEFKALIEDRLAD